MNAGISAENLLPLIEKLIAELHPDAAGHRQVTLDSELDRDLGLDSLARMELFQRLEREFRVKLPERMLLAAETPRDLLRSLQRESAPPGDRRENGAAAGAGPAKVETAGRRETGLAEAKTLIDVLEGHARLQPNALHLTLLADDKEVPVSYGQLRQEALRAAARLREAGLSPGETVAIMLPTSVEYFYNFFGIIYCGGIPVPLYPPARPTQIEEHIRRHRKILANAGTRILITVPEIKSVARLLMSQVPELKKIVTDTLHGEPEPLPLTHKENDIAFIQYTSGSTGDPKGVILTHGNLLANIRAMGRACRVTADDVFVSWLPLYHDMGLIGAWLGSLCLGYRLVVMPPLSFLARPVRWLHTIAKYRGTLSASPNFGYEICATRLRDQDLEGLDLSSWRMACNGAEPVIPDTLRRFQERFTPYGLRPEALAPVYGLAECSVGLLFPEPGSGVRIDRVSREKFAAGHAMPATGGEAALEFVRCGRPLPGHQVRVVDGQDRELPERREGRLQFKGPSATSGYFRNPAETKKLFRGEWLETGDLAYFAKGEIYLTGRVKDVIIRGGRNIYPHELEEIVGNIDGIRKGCTAVFGSVKERGETERLVVLTESRHTEAETLDRLRRQIAEATVDLLDMPPDDVVIGRPGTVLKTSSGKIRRSACRQLYESGHLGRQKPAVWLQLARMAAGSVRPMLRRFAGRARALVYAGHCWLVFALGGVATWLGLMLLPAGEKCWRLAGRAVRLMGRAAGLSLTTRGLENIPVGSQYLVVGNHMSYLDSPVLAGVLPEPCNFVGKAELGRNPLLRPALAKLGVFLVDRFDPAQGVADSRKIDEGVDRGLRPIFFAEGTLHRMPGLLPFQMGAFVLACRRQLPVVPVVIRGTRDILRGGSWFPRRGRIEVTILAPCRPAGTEWPDAIELRDTVRREILRHLPEPDLAGEFTSLLQTGLKPENRRQKTEDRP